jgi:DNA-binding IclR family transcriptional regulator
MLTKLIQAINRAKGPIEVTQLCHELGVERSVLEGMLVTLRQMGYIEQDRIQKTELTLAKGCTSCSIKGCASCGQPRL